MQCIIQELHFIQRNPQHGIALAYISCIKSINYKISILFVAAYKYRVTKPVKMKGPFVLIVSVGDV